MKILTGSLRGRALPFTPSPDLRPTADKVRKAVFDVLQDFVQGKTGLDLYSGTGAMGFEALSRGASFVRFVEKNASRAKRIEAALQRWGLQDSAEVWRLDVLDAVRRMDAHQPRRGGFETRPYDLVFLDPPYEEGLALETLKALADTDLVRDGGFVIVECGKHEKLPEKLGSLSALRDKRYGQSRVLFYRFKRPG